MYSALCANDCTLSTEDGVLIKEITAHQQDFFVSPGTKVATTDASVILTECFNLASFGLSTEWGATSEDESEDNLTDSISALQSSLSELGDDLTSITSQVDELSTQLSSQESSISDLQSDSTSLSSSLSAQQESIAALEIVASTPKVMPDWDNAVFLSLTSFPYTALTDGWICGSLTHSSANGYIYVNGIRTCAVYIDNSAVQMIVNEGDIISLTATSIHLNFIPFKN